MELFIDICVCVYVWGWGGGVGYGDSNVGVCNVFYLECLEYVIVSTVSCSDICLYPIRIFSFF